MNLLKQDRMTIWAYSLVHGLIDLASALTAYNAAIILGLPPVKAAILIILYDLIAFASQPLVGFFIDYVKGFRIAMLMGIVLIFMGVVLVSVNALLGVVAVGFGNALFHLGAGAQILHRYPNTATSLGIFVGPGALGLSIGFWFGNQGFFPFWYLTIALLISGIGLTYLPSLKAIPVRTGAMPCQVKAQPNVVFLLLVAIAIRGFVGRTGFAGLQSEAFTIIGLGIAACIGKMVGGSIADRFGWSLTTITALFLSGVGIVFAHYHIGVAFASMILFQVTMPVTLTLTSAALPGRPAFAFGLTCLALVIGTLSAFYIPQRFAPLPVTLAMVVISGACILVALWRIGYIACQTRERPLGNLGCSKPRVHVCAQQSGVA